MLTADTAGAQRIMAKKLTPLHKAARAGATADAEHLIADGADVHAKHTDAGVNGWTPLHYAAESGNPHMVELLIRKGGADVYAKTGTFLKTSLHLAAAHGHLFVVRIFIATGMNIDVRDGSGKTPLDLAERGGHSDVVAALKEARNKKEVESNARH